MLIKKVFICIIEHLKTNAYLRKEIAAVSDEIENEKVFIDSITQQSKENAEIHEQEMRDRQCDYDKTTEYMEGIYQRNKKMEDDAVILIRVLLHCGLSYEEVYTLVSPILDREGFIRHDIAVKMTGIEADDYFYAEDLMGYFADANGNYLLKWIEYAKFGEIKYRYCQCYEVVDTKTLDTTQPGYIAYRTELHERTINKIMADIAEAAA